MSSLKVLTVLLLVLSTSYIIAEDEDFAFELSKDLEIKVPQENDNYYELEALVGHIFHFIIPVNLFDQKVENYSIKKTNGSPLPNWLLFEKTSGVFWGIPFRDDVETIDITVRGILPQKTKTMQFKITVKDSYSVVDNIKNCSKKDDVTFLSLVVKKSLKSIEPKQRVVTINNISKFFGLPQSAFTLTDEPVNQKSSKQINSKNKRSKSISSIEVPVGCNGKFWAEVAPIIHQLKKQTKDGTISVITNLPIKEWKIFTRHPPVIRKKRFTDDNGGIPGSGDYDDYGYDYDQEYDDDDDDDEEDTTNSVAKASQPISSTGSSESETHPHRHHHGETKPFDEEEPNILVVKDPTSAETPSSSSSTSAVTSYLNTTTNSTPTETTPLTSSTRQTSISWTSTESPSTMQNSNEFTTMSSIEISEEVTESDLSSSTHRTNIYQPVDVPDEEYEVDEYEETPDNEFDDEDDDDDGSVTEVPTEKPIHRTTSSSRSFTFNPDKSSEETLTTIEEDEFIDKLIPTDESSYTSSLPIATSSTWKDEPLVLNTTISTPSHVTTRTTINFDDFTDDWDENSTSTSKFYIFSTTSTPSLPETSTMKVRNDPPSIRSRLNSIPVVCGKVFEFIIPENTFSDREDGSNLTLELLDQDGNPLQKDSWCQFNPKERKIYGLPVEDHISRWDYLIRATDSDGASVSDLLKIQVQDYQSRRSINHEFSLHVILEKKYEFPYTIDWALRILHGLGALYGSNLSDITVRRINKSYEAMEFTWTNDSLPTNLCSKKEIIDAFKLLTSSDNGEPSKSLTTKLAPAIRVKKVTYQLLGICYTPTTTVSSAPKNDYPVVLNGIDHLNATVGELLVFKVPDDTFYDKEDNSQNLKLYLLTGDNKQIPTENWLQFDSDNKEFFGIPQLKDVGRKVYTLTCEDSGKLPAYDSLEVIVNHAPKINYTVEFQMTINTDYKKFATSPVLQRKFVEKLRDLFEDRDTGNIQLKLAKAESTLISWYNKSLPTDYCPKKEIKRLTSILINDISINDRVISIMGPEFVVKKIEFKPLSFCPLNLLDRKTAWTEESGKTVGVTEVTEKIKPDDSNVVKTTTKLKPDDSNAEENTNNEQSSHDEYLLTYIVPSVIIAAMLLLAAIAACILYRRRRSGKMNVEEDGRQSYGNKGIPVIFQEELEEKPDSGIKAPVILKDEKPPLAPPEYSKSGSLKINDDSEPYHPPPPFARTQDNGKQSRPKPTPTYRKPPPYVPP